MLKLAVAVLFFLTVAIAAETSEVSGQGASKFPKISEETFGVTQAGQTVKRYILSNGNNITVQIIDFGGIIQSIEVPDNKGAIVDVTTGFDELKYYEAKHPSFGALIGRVANRIGGGKFTLDGKTYQLALNNGPNSIHGGIKGWDKYVWTSRIENDKLVLEHVSPDGDEHFPGEVTCTVTYELNIENELVIDYVATTTKATPINPTNHAYFNLAGHDAGNIHNHLVTVNADFYLPKNNNGSYSIPTGRIAYVEGTVFDLRQPVKLGDRINNIPGDLGYDHYYCAALENSKKHVARVEEPHSGRVLDVYTTQPGFQLYTGNYLNNVRGKRGAVYKKHGALCIETQNYPDAINKPNFPNSVLRPGEIYHHITWYKFTTTQKKDGY